MQQELLELFSPLSLSFESVTVMLAGEKKTDKQTSKQINEFTLAQNATGIRRNLFPS